MDLVFWNKDESIEDFIIKLFFIKKIDIMSKGIYYFVNIDSIVYLEYYLGNEKFIGIFNFENLLSIKVDLIDGKYLNIFINKFYEVKNGLLLFCNEFIIFYLK